MSSLLELQTAFGSGLVAGPDAALLDRLAGSPARNAGRLAAYRRNFVGSGRMALASTFPVLRTLLGDRFQTLADDYLAAHASRDADLNRLGDRFPAFAGGHRLAEEYRWLPAMAELEWVLQETYDAAGEMPEALSAWPALAALPPDRQALAVLLIWPGARTMFTEQPVLEIWAAHQSADPDQRDSRLAAIDRRPRSRVLMTTRRADGECGVVELSSGERVFYRACRDRQPLAAAFSEALAAEPGFAVGEVLAKGIERGWLVGWRFVQRDHHGQHDQEGV